VRRSAGSASQPTPGISYTLHSTPCKSGVILSPVAAVGKYIKTSGLLIIVKAGTTKLDYKLS